MIKYFKELENREDYYLALVNVEDMENFETYISNLENSWS